MKTKASTKPNEVKKLYRSENDRRITGLCGGIAEYFEIDSSLVRLAWIIFTVVTGLVLGVLAYLVAAIVVPNEPIRIVIN